MKVKLISEESGIFKNYTNVKTEDINNISNNSCFEIYCDENILKTITPEYFSKFINILVSKIRHGGKIIVCGYDLHKICLSYTHKYINENNVADFLKNSNGFYNCRMIENEIKANSLSIHSMSLVDNVFVVRGIRE